MDPVNYLFPAENQPRTSIIDLYNIYIYIS